MPLLICPGMHPSRYTQAFLRTLPDGLAARSWVLPGQVLPVFPVSVLNSWVASGFKPEGEPLTIIAFSAGVVGAGGAAWMWQQLGGRIAHFFALDGWGVPIVGIPAYRLSHDKFTHDSSLPLGHGPISFYADPPVLHLTLWNRPGQVTGWRIEQTELGEMRSRTTAAAFIASELGR